MKHIGWKGLTGWMGWDAGSIGCIGWKGQMKLTGTRDRWELLGWTQWTG